MSNVLRDPRSGPPGEIRVVVCHPGPKQWDRDRVCGYVASIQALLPAHFRAIAAWDDVEMYLEHISKTAPDRWDLWGAEVGGGRDREGLPYYHQVLVVEMEANIGRATGRVVITALRAGKKVWAVSPDDPSQFREVSGVVQIPDAAWFAPYRLR